MPHKSHDLQSRAGLIASECSLLGLGAGVATCLALATALHGPSVLPIGRDALVVSASLVSAGVVATVLGHAVDLGGCRSVHRRLARSWLPPVVFGSGLAILLWLAAFWAWPASGKLVPMPLIILQLASGGLALFTLAAVGLRVLAAGTPAPGPGLAVLVQTVSHCIAGGLAIYLLLVAATDRLSPLGRQHLTASLSMMLGLSALWASILLRDSRVRGRIAGPPTPSTAEYEQAHYLASAATLLGLALPGLVILYVSLSDHDSGLLVACGMAAGSGHVMRYAWVVLANQGT